MTVAAGSGSRWRRYRLGAAAIIVLLVALGFWRLLPEPLLSRPYSPVLFARGGELLGARLAADRQWRLPLHGAPPERFLQALVAFEDRRFHQHPGVDPLALLRALRQNWQAGRVVSGASTLSMQVVRMARAQPSRTLFNKLWEALLALRLELSYSKPEILALYAQHAPFGGNVVGVESAAWRYFGRSAGALSWAEAATLAVLPNAPALIHPGRGRQALQAKRDRLLQRLHGEGLLDALDLRLALAEPLPGTPRPWPSLAPHLLDSLAAGRYGADPQAVPAFDSTLDGELQTALVELIERHGNQLAAEGVHNAAALVIDQRDFSVAAYLGNTRFDAGSARGHAIDLIPRARSSGSILKPLLYALMLEHGELLPETLVADVPTQINGYVPENFDRSYRGAVSAREALALSLNIPAVRLLRQYGLARFHAALRQMGMHSLVQAPEHYGLTLILGGAEVSLWEVAQFYANLAAAAQQAGPPEHYRWPLLLQTAKPALAGAREYAAGAAWLTLEALAEVNRPGAESHWKNFASSRKLAWKTGTSFGLRDAWAVGSTPRYTVAVWAGNASGEGVAGLSGSQTAAPLLFAILNRLPADGWFAPPLDDLKLIASCAADGFRERAGCASASQWAPRHSRFDRGSPHHRRIHLDAQLQQRVHAGCEAVANMREVSWFQLPAGQEYFYRRQHPDYRPLPPWRPDCVAGALAAADEAAIGLIYPQDASQLYLPAELDGHKSRAVFQAVHRDPRARLHWHLDDRYLGSTHEFHQWEIIASAGEHRLTLVDDQGQRFSRRFTVLSKFAGGP